MAKGWSNEGILPLGYIPGVVHEAYAAALKIRSCRISVVAIRDGDQVGYDP